MLLQMSCRVPVLQHPAHGRNSGAPVDHVFPSLPVLQWVLAVPKWLRYFLQRGRRVQWPLYFGKPTLVMSFQRPR
jgi:hypothetical protein